MQHFLSWVRHHLFISICLLMALVALAAAGVIVVQSHIPPSKPAFSCGGITLPNHGTRQYAVPADEIASEDCFAQAYQRCHSTSLDVAWMSVDTGASTTLIIEPQNHACQIISTSSNYGPGTAPNTQIDSCQGLKESADSLVIVNCGGSNITLPRTLFCGYISSDKASFTHNQQTAACFTQHYHNCSPAALDYELPITGPILEQSFVFNSSCHIMTTINTDNHLVPCAALVQQTNALLFQGCSQYGNIPVPIKP